MGSFGRLLLVLVMGLAGTPLSAAEQLVIRIEGDDWGDADKDNIQAVLQSAGRELLQVVPPARPIHIRVISTGDAPQVDYRRAASGEFTVRLAVRGRHWAQFAFQFAHELGHIVTHYDRRSDNKIGNENQWFDESVGEAASLFVLKRMAETWKVKPPYSNWKSYAPALADYADRRIRGVEAPAEERIPAWFARNRPALRADPYLRDRNQVVAVHLVRLLERDPHHWEAFRYLNLGRPDPTNSFESYLENWYFSVPREQKPFVQRVVALLGVKSETIARHAGR